MFILASASPRRKELLQKLVFEFVVIAPKIKEERLRYNAFDLPYQNAKSKAYAVFSSHPNDTVLSCDTIVYCDGLIFGKPKDEKEAYTMLKTLSNNTHLVISSYTLINKEKEVSRIVTSVVTFFALSDELIHRYIKTGSPFDKAGGYGIQDDSFPLIKNIVGSVDNVIGLPTEDLAKHLKGFI